MSAPLDLFPEPRQLPLPGADVVYYPAPDLGASPDELLRDLTLTLPWEQHHVRIHGHTIPQPRLSSWHGEVAHTYSTLAHILQPKPWTKALQALRCKLEGLCATTFNSVLANRYRNGQDCIGWHSDDEPELGPAPIIASVSLGAERRFDLRRRDDYSTVKSVVLQHGSLLVMSGATQRLWQHSIARTKTPLPERINLTFRLTHPLRT